MGEAAKEVLTIVVPLLIAVVTLVGGQLAAKKQAQASPYNILADRVVALEKRDNERDLREARMHGEQLIDRDCIRQLVLFIERKFPGEKLPFRLPSWYYAPDPGDTTEPKEG